MSYEHFQQTLKSLKCPNAKKISESDFDDIILNPELAGFMNYMCSTFNELNVLTTEEIDEFASIPPYELESLEKLVYSEGYCENPEEEDKKRKQDENQLECELNHVQNCHQHLQLQKDILQEHKKELVVEKAKCEELNSRLQRHHNHQTGYMIPQAKMKISSELNSIQELLNESKTAMNLLSESNVILPNFSEKDLEEYYETEEKIANYVQSCLQNDLQFEDEQMTVLDIPGLSNEKVSKEIHLLSKHGEIMKMSEIEAVTAYEKKSASTIFLKNYEAGKYNYIKDASSSQLKLMLSEQKILNEKLSKQEIMLKTYLSNAVTDRLEAECCQIAIAHCTEVLEFYTSCLEIISSPHLHLLNQEARLQSLVLYNKIYQQRIREVKSLVKEIYNYIESEYQISLERTKQIEKVLKENKPEEEFLSPDSLFVSAYKILNNEPYQNFCKLTMSDLVGEIQQLSKKMEQKEKKKEIRKDILKSMEQQYSRKKKVVLDGKEFFQLMKLDENFHTYLHRFDVLLSEAHKNVQESETFWRDKKAILKTKKNVQLARMLYLYALLEYPSFEGLIETIKKAKENEVETKPPDDSSNL